MRAVRYQRFGPADVLEVAEIAEPVPDAGQSQERLRVVKADIDRVKKDVESAGGAVSIRSTGRSAPGTSA